MFLTNLFKLNKKCTHDKITPDIETGYCPDCGKLMENNWYITRCACCGVKLRTMCHRGEIIPQEHFCTNCGSEEFRIEKIEKINFIDINYAVLIKKEISEDENNFAFTTQCWQEKTNEIPRLPILYL